MRRSTLGAALVIALVAPAMAQHPSYEQQEWQFEERTDQITLEKSVRGQSVFWFVNDFAVLSIICLSGKPAVAATYSKAWLSPNSFRYRFDESPGKSVNAKRSQDTIIVDGGAAAVFIRSALKAQSVTIETPHPSDARFVRFDLAGFKAGAADLLKACRGTLK